MDVKGNLNFVLMLEKKGMSPLRLEEKSGVPIANIMKFVRGRKDINRAWAVTVSKLADALKCKVSDILNTPTL